MASTDLRVAISGFAGLDNPEPGTGVARALRLGWRGRLEIEALGYDAWTTGACSPGIADRLHLMPPLAAGDEATLRRILEVHARRRLDALIPCLDLEVPVYARLARRLEHAGIRTLLPLPDNVCAVAKTALPFFCYAHKILTPHTVHVPSVADIPLYADQFGYPLIVKGTVAGATRVESREQAGIEASRLNARWGGGVLLQQLLEGEEYVVAMVARGDGSCLGLVAMRKLGINHRGKGVVGAVVDDPSLEREARRILAKLHWRGPLELEFVRTHEEGKLYLIEINCRFPNWILLSHWAGCNLPVLLLREILQPGRRRSRPPRPGAAFVRDVEEVAVPVDRLEKLVRFGTVNGTPFPPSRAARASPDGIRVAVTGISAFDLVMPGLGVARALRAAPEIGRVYGLAYGPYDTGAHRSRLFDAVFRMPESDDPAELLQWLREIQEKEGLDVVLPCMDAELPLFLAVADELERMGVRTLLPSQAALDRRAKERIYRNFGHRDWGGFQIPRSLCVRSPKQVDRAARILGFPLVIKRSLGSASTVYDRAQARAACSALCQEDGERAVIQGFISGEEFTVAALCGRDHRMLGAVAVKKLLRCERGKMWGAIHMNLPELVAGLAPFLEKLPWCGPVEVEFIRDSTRERFMLIEVNPRFPAWIGFTADLGVNLPRDAVLAALDRPPGPRTLARDLLFMRNCEEISVDAQSFAHLATRGMLRYG